MPTSSTLGTMLIDVVKRAVADAPALFFDPINQIIKLFRSEGIKTTSDIAGQALKRTIDATHGLVTYHQKGIIEYIFSSSKKHKALREELSKTVFQQRRLQGLLDDLTDHLNMGFFEACAASFTHLHAHFRDRSRTPPRISIRGSFKTTGSASVVTIFGDSVKYGDTHLFINDDTSLQASASTGRYFFCNDLVEGVAEGIYSNSYIKNDVVRNVLSTSPVMGRFALERRWNTIWSKFQEKGGSRPPSKSILVIPITLFSTHINSDFLQRIDVSDESQLIFGFICFEHDDVGYFIRDIDIPFGYVAADLLSVYAFHRMKYLDFSEVYKKAHESLVAAMSGQLALGDQGPDEPTDEEIRASIVRVLDEIRDVRARMSGMAYESSAKILVDNEISFLSLLDKLHAKDVVEQIDELALAIDTAGSTADDSERAHTN